MGRLVLDIRLHYGLLAAKGRSLEVNRCWCCYTYNALLYTCGFLQLRAGPRSATRSAIFGGVLLAFIEGAGLMLNRVMTQPPPIEDPVPQVTGPPTGIFLFRTPNTAGIPGASGIPGAWFGSWYGGGKKEEPKTYNEKLDNFDANPAPLFQVSRSNKRA